MTKKQTNNFKDNWARDLNMRLTKEQIWLTDKNMKDA